MANIRWDSTRNTNDASANQLFSGGGAKIENALSALSKLGRRVDNEVIDQNNTDNRAAMRSELDSISNFGTNKGNFANEVLDAKYGKGRYDAEAKNNFLDSQLGNLQAKENTQYAYDENQRNKREKPLIAAIRNQYANGNFADGLASLGNADIFDKSALTAAGRTGFKQNSADQRGLFENEQFNLISGNKDLTLQEQQEAYANSLQERQGRSELDFFSADDVTNGQTNLATKFNSRNQLSDDEQESLDYQLQDNATRNEAQLNSVINAENINVANNPGVPIRTLRQQEADRAENEAKMGELENSSWWQPDSWFGESDQTATKGLVEQAYLDNPTLTADQVNNALRVSKVNNLWNSNSTKNSKFTNSINSQIALADKATKANEEALKTQATNVNAATNNARNDTRLFAKQVKDLYKSKDNTGIPKDKAILDIYEKLNAPGVAKKEAAAQKIIDDKAAKQAAYDGQRKKVTDARAKVKSDYAAQYKANHGDNIDAVKKVDDANAAAKAKEQAKGLAAYNNRRSPEAKALKKANEDKAVISAQKDFAKRQKAYNERRSPEAKARLTASEAALEKTVNKILGKGKKKEITLSNFKTLMGKIKRENTQFAVN